MDHPDRIAQLGKQALLQSGAFGMERMAKPVIDWLKN
jgi:hypothetical protein